MAMKEQRTIVELERILENDLETEVSHDEAREISRDLLAYFSTLNDIASRPPTPISKTYEV